VMKLVRDPAMKDKLIKLGYEPIGSNGIDLAAAQKNRFGSLGKTN